MATGSPAAGGTTYAEDSLQVPTTHNNHQTTNHSSNINPTLSVMALNMNLVHKENQPQGLGDSSIDMLISSPMAGQEDSPGSNSTSITKLVETIGLLYKSKLSLSLRTAHLKRLMTEHFSSATTTHHHSHHHSTNTSVAASTGNPEDAEIARWIASSALSELELEEEQQRSPSPNGTTDAAVSEGTTASEELDETPEPCVQDQELTLNDSSASAIQLGIPDPCKSNPSSEATNRPPPASNLSIELSADPSKRPPGDVRTIVVSQSDATAATNSIPFPTTAATLSPITSPAADEHAPTYSTAPHFTSPTTLYHQQFTPHNNARKVSTSSTGVSTPNDGPATPIINSADPNISSLIGKGFNTRRGSVPGGIRRSSTSEPMKGLSMMAAAVVAHNNTIISSGRVSPAPLNIANASSSVTASIASIPIATSHTLATTINASVAPTINAPIPATALQLVSSSEPIARSASHGQSPVLSSSPTSGPVTTPLSMPLLGRTISAESRQRKKAREDGSTRRSSHIYFTLSPAITECLHKVWQWDFDLWEFVDLVPETPLTTMTCFLLERWGLFNTFNIDRATFHRFITAIESGYLDNPYHNKVHAADVVQNIHCVLLGFMQKPTKESGALCVSLTPLDILASLIAAAIHDYKHTGTTNLFHQATVSDLAIRYNDVSILENMHVSEAFALILRNPEMDIFASLSREQRREIRETIVQMVLATDMKQHISMLTDLQATVEQKKAKDTWFDVSSRADRLLLLKNCLHLSDIANPTKPTSSCVKWADRIVKEWFLQGDMERNLKIDISPMMDRHNANVEKSQIGFIDFFIQPLYTTWFSITPSTQIALDYLKLNRAYWVARAEANQANSTAAATTTATAATTPASVPQPTLNTTITPPTTSTATINPSPANPQSNPTAQS